MNNNEVEINAAFFVFRVENLKSAAGVPGGTTFPAVAVSSLSDPSLQNRSC